MDFSELKGKTLKEISGEVGDEKMIFKVTDEEIYKLFHEQDWCESVSIEDICGDISDLVGYPILLAEEVINDNETPEGVELPEYYDSYTWTFYKLATIKGSVTIRWYGESNGYYSEGVDFKKV